MAQHGQYLNESKNPAIGNPRAIAAGEALWATSCAGCHGPDGSGGRGPNLVRRALWHPLTDEGIHKTIREGVPGTDMPPTSLSDEQTWSLVAFVKSLTGPASETLGLSLQPITPQIAQALNLPAGTTGVVIAGISPSSDAAQKGLQRGDVIVAIQGQRVTTPQQVVAAVNLAKKAGRTSVLLLVKRGTAPEAFVGIDISGD